MAKAPTIRAGSNKDFKGPKAKAGKTKSIGTVLEAQGLSKRPATSIGGGKSNRQARTRGAATTIRSKSSTSANSLSK